MIDLDTFFVSFINGQMIWAILKIFFVFPLRRRSGVERELRRRKSGDCGGETRGEREKRDKGRYSKTQTDKNALQKCHGCRIGSAACL